VCPPGLHISLGIFFRVFSLLEDDCHQLEVKHTLQLQGSTAGSTFNTFVTVLQQQSTLRHSIRRITEQIVALEQLLTLTLVTVSPSAPQFTQLISDGTTAVNNKKQERLKMVQTKYYIIPVLTAYDIGN
jgi:hypothetical protein